MSSGIEINLLLRVLKAGASITKKKEKIHIQKKKISTKPMAYLLEIEVKSIMNIP